VVAFSGTGCIGAVVIPEGVTSISDEAFKNAAAITSIHIPASVTSIGGGAFDGAGVQTVTFASNSQMTSIGPYSFIAAKSLSSISIPNSVTSIAGAAFMYTDSLTSLYIPDNVISIGGYAFHRSGLTSITIPAAVTSIGENAFSGAGALAELVFLSDAAPTVGGVAFSEVASSAKAYIKPGASGFTASGTPPLWNGIAVEVDQVRITAAAAEQARPAAAERARIAAAAAAERARIAAAAAKAKAAAAKAKAKELASRTVSAKKSYAAKTLAQRVGVPIVSSKASVTLSVASGSKKVCAKSGSKLKALVAGKCVVTLTVQEPTPKASKVTKNLVIGIAGSRASWKENRSYSIAALATGASVSRTSKDKLTVSVSTSSRDVCTKSGSSLKMLKPGTCKVTFTVQKPTPKATKTTKTFVVK
jgi:hypothetical protein